MVQPVGDVLPADALLPCPGRTEFDVLSSRWPDQEFISWYEEGARQRELALAARPPALHVTVVSDTRPPGEYHADPDTGTVSVVVTGPLPVVGRQEPAALEAGETAEEAESQD